MKQIVLLALLATSTTLSLGQTTRTTANKTSRQSVRASSPATYTGRQIAVGSGGGVTGYSTAYYLLDNGKLFGKRSRDTTFTFIKQQSMASTKRMFSMAEEKCKIKTTRFDNPGNTYKFVRWRKAQKEYIVTWGGVGKTVPANYPKLYNSFMAMIPTTSTMK